MKKIFLLMLPLLLLTSCELEEVLTGTTQTGEITKQEAANGLKDALVKGVSEGTSVLSQVNGYYGNPKVKIPFPPNAQKVADRLKAIGLEKEVDKVVQTINRGAEDAAGKAKPIFTNAIRSMTFADAMDILFGADSAATHYLRHKTYNQLYDEFKPVISESLDKVNATKHWTDIVERYNQIPMVEDVNPDLVDYVNRRALNGLFKMVAEEEERIRKNPQERTTALMKKVFNYYDKNK